MAMPTNEHITSSTGEALDKLPRILTRFPVSRSAWYQGVKDGKYPKPIKLGARAVAWKRSDIDRLIESLTT